MALNLVAFTVDESLLIQITDRLYLEVAVVKTLEEGTTKLILLLASPFP